MSAWREAVATVRPSREGRDGPLPPLLVTLTVVTGLVDSVSYLKLGHVFVANMTGNVVFLGFALAGASGLSVLASLTALGTFLIGSIAGGRLGSARAAHRGLMLRDTMLIELALVGAAVVVTALNGGHVDAGVRYVVIVLLAFATGVQNATALRLAVPDLTTTVLTRTITGIGADSRLGGGVGSHSGRRLVAVAAMLLGALIGALLVLQVDETGALALVLALLVTAALAAHWLSRVPAEWARAR